MNLFPSVHEMGCAPQTCNFNMTTPIEYNVVQDLDKLCRQQLNVERHLHICSQCRGVQESMISQEPQV